MAVNTLQAQGDRSKRRARLIDYQERLQLSDSQIAEVKEIRKKYKPEMKAIRNDASKSKADKMRALADIIEKKDADIANVLSLEQMKEWEVIKAEVKERLTE